MNKNWKNQLKELLTGHTRNHTIIFFVFIFAAIAAAAGLSHTFADQSQVYFSLSPPSQYANANEDKTVSLSLNTNNQPVDMGKVALIYDANVISLISYGAQPGYIHINSQSITAGRIEFSFQVDAGAPSVIDLGVLTFRAKPLASTQFSRLSFAPDTAANMSGSAYPAAYGQGAIVVYAATTSATSSPPSSGSSSSSSPIVANPNTNSSTTQGRPSTTTLAPTTAKVISTNSNGSAGSLSNVTSASNSGTLGQTVSTAQSGATTSRKNKRNLAPIIVPAVILALGIGAIAYSKYLERQPVKSVRAKKKRHSSIFGTDTPVDDGEVISPGARPQPKMAPIAAAITRLMPQRKVALPPPAPKPAPSPVVPMHKTPEPPIPVKPPKPPEPEIVEEDPDMPSVVTVQKTDEVDIQISHKKLSEARAEAELAAQDAQIKEEAAKRALPPVHPPQPPVKPPIHVAPPPPKPEHKPAPAPEPPIEHHKVIQPLKISELPLITSTNTPAHKTKSAEPDNIPIMPTTRRPDWQSHLQLGLPKVQQDDPPDMFELAEQHPESFGSTQLYEKEIKEKDDHDKGKK